MGLTYRVTFSQVLHLARVVAKLEPGEAQLSLLRVSRALRAERIETRLLCGWADPAGVALARAHGLSPEVYGERRDAPRGADPGFVRWLRPRLRDADVIHAHTLGGWWAAARAAGPDVPLVVSQHDPLAWPDEPPPGRPKGQRRVDLFYAHGARARAAALAAGVPPDRLRDGLSPVVGLDARPRPWLPAPRLVFVGRLHEQDGPAVLLEALAARRGSPVCFMLGSGPSELALRRRAARGDLRGRVHFCGRRRDPASWIAGASGLVIGPGDAAAHQTAVLGMGLGVPVIATDADELSEILSDSRGLTVTPGDSVALAAVVSGVISGRLQTDLAGARRWARQFDVERVASVYETDYRRLKVQPAVAVLGDGARETRRMPTAAPEPPGRGAPRVRAQPAASTG